eukprot:TRINITY_DN2486_c0_g1_i1.p1 TRINITY_DN2486_c0_g1~~TRINITY_DN2486_c0_g1_i1.p1  ORF type:complete len:133 (+),score=17.57 TRINITY_DN2486_c0_g1_i1:77-475(+)
MCIRDSFISIVLILVGFFILYLGRVRTIRLDKEEYIISKATTTIICTRKKTVRSLSDIAGVQIIKKGKDAGVRDTTRYKVALIFNTGRHFSVRGTRDLNSAKLTAIKLEYFLYGHCVSEKRSEGGLEESNRI